MAVRVTDDDPSDEFEEFDEQEFDEFEEKDLGPDERDIDLMDGTWEHEHYAGRTRSRDWNAITAGIALIVVIALVLPALLVFFD